MNEQGPKNRMKKRNSIKFKIPILITSFILVIMTIFGGITIYLEKLEREQKLRELSEQIINRISHSLITPIWNLDAALIEEDLLLEIANEHVLAIILKEDDQITAAKIKETLKQITDYDPDNTLHQKRLKNSYFSLNKDIMYNNRNIGTVTINFTKYFINRALYGYTVFYILKILLLTISITIIISFLINKNIIKQIDVLKKASEEIGKGDYEYRVHIKTGDEFENLGKFLNRMTHDLKISMNNIKEQTQIKAALEKEMELAENIQTALLPRNPNIDGFEILAYMETADSVGGDYYDVINVAGKDWVVIGDVSGHGIQAGLIMMMAQTSIHTVLNQNPEISPKDLLTTINITISENIAKLGDHKYMTIIVLALKEDHNLYFSGMHLPMMIYRDQNKDIEVIDTDGMWLGFDIDLDTINTNKKFSLETNDVLLLYSDGLTEARDGSQELFSQKRLENLLRENGTNQLENIKSEILDSLENYNIDDDITFVILKRNK